MLTSEKIAFFSLCVSVAAFVLSVISYWRTRKALYIRTNKNALRIKNTFALNKNGETVSDPFDMSATHVIQVSLVNPTSVPISYFELEVTDKDRKQFFLFPVQPWVDTYKLYNLSYSIPDTGVSLRFLLPEETHGVLGPNEFKALMIAINACEHKEVYVSLKITKRKIYKSRRHSRPEFYKTISKKVLLP